LENRLNGFENGKTQLLNSEGVVKLVYFQKKWSIPLKSFVLPGIIFAYWVEKTQE